METIYALVIILTGTLLPNADASPDVLSGEVVNTTTVYFRTLEACQSAHADAVANQNNMAPPGMDIKVVVKDCEGIQVAE